MKFQITEAAELIKELAEEENLTLSFAFKAFVNEAELSLDLASELKAALFESYTLDSMASDSLTNALSRTFGNRDTSDIHEVATKETAEGTKYKIRVKDKNSGSSYTRYATRAKIAELRANPNISSVEMSDYGDTSEDRDGQKTASAKRGDRDGDNKVESPSKEHAGLVHNAIQRKMGGRPDGKDTRRENFITIAASDYFLNEGLNEDGVSQLVDILGPIKFGELVYEIAEEVEEELLFEARAGGVKIDPVTKGGKSIGSLKGGAKTSAIKRLRKKKAEERAGEGKGGKGSMKDALKAQSKKKEAEPAVSKAKEKQPKKRGFLDSVAHQVNKGMERHRKAMELARETGKVAKKAGKIGGEVAKGAVKGAKGAVEVTKKVSDKLKEEYIEEYIIVVSEEWNPNSLQEMPMSGTMSGNNAMNNAAEKQNMKQQEREQKKMDRMQMQQQKLDTKNSAGNGMMMAHNELEGASLFEKYKEMRKAKKSDGDCVDKSEKNMHNCAKKVCHEQYGEGDTIFGRHAIPDENGFVSHYDVQFEHGIVEFVSVEDLEIFEQHVHSEHIEYANSLVERDNLVNAGAQHQSEREDRKITGKGVDNSVNVKLMPVIGEELVTEKAVSKAQQKFMGMIYATKKGDMKGGSKAVKDAAASMSTKDAKDYASTDHKGLPDKKESIELDSAGMPILKEYSRNNAEGPTDYMVKPNKDEDGEIGVKNPKGPKQGKKELMGGDRRKGVGPGAGV